MRTFLRPLVPRMESGMCLLCRCMPYSFFVFLVFLSFNIQAQRQSMNCFGQVNISIPPSGEIPLEPRMVTGMTNLENVIVYLAGRDEPILDCRERNTEVQYFLRDTIENLECWGVILVEDKNDFEVECNDGLIPCINGLDSLNPGDFIKVVDNCLTLDDLKITYTDGPLDLFPTPSDTVGQILRTWILMDESGVTKECNSLIYLEPLPCDSLVIPPDTTIYCGQDPRDFDLTGYLNYTEAQLLQNCHVAVSTSITDSLSYNCGAKQKYIRKWRISDWVTGTVKDTIQIIIVEDTTIATLVAPASLPVLFDQCNPYAIIDPLDSVIQNCTDVSNSDISVFVNGGLFPAAIGDTVPINIGSNQFIYSATNACLSRLVPDTINQVVTAPDRPILVCDSSLNRAISMNMEDSIKVLIDNAFASANVISCIPYRLLARKIDPICGTTADTFMTYLEFCVEETLPKILIELVAEDSLGRRSDTCEVWLDIQEKTPPTLTIVSNPTVELDSTGVFTLDSAVIISTYADNSGCISNISVTGSGLGITGSGMGMSPGSLSFLNGGVWTTFTCQDTGQYFVKVTVTDCNNNMTMDTTTLTVNSGGNCGHNTAPAYSGTVTAYGLEAMDGAILTLSSDEIELISITDLNGHFDFEIPVDGQIYRMSGFYPDDWKTGITANDLALMEEFILGIRELDEYQFVSGDVDDNGKVTLIDVLTAKKILLGLQDHVQDLEPWRFRLATPEHLLPLSELNNTDLQRGGLNIHAMKRGDLDADAMGASIVRSMGEIIVEKLETSQRLNSKYRLHFGQPDQIRALQASIKTIAGIQFQVVDAHPDIQTSIKNGVIDVLYYQHTDDQSLWIDIEISAKDGKVFSLDNRIKPTVWYYNNDVRHLRLKSRESISEYPGNVKLELSAHPNPMTVMTTITMKWDESLSAQPALISLSDALGRTISIKNYNLPHSTGQMKIPLEIPVDPGLYFLTAQTAEHRYQLKIVKN